jgi:hypothetical protein
MQPRIPKKKKISVSNKDNRRMVATTNLSGKSSKLHSLRRKPSERKVEPVLAEEQQASIPSDY